MQFTFITLSILLILISVISYFIKRGEKSRYEKLNAFIEEEMEANKTLNQEIPESLFFKPDLRVIPALDYESEKNERLVNRHKLAKELGRKKMLKFNNEMTNKDIKLNFGYDNLKIVTEYEENYHSFVQSIISLAETYKRDKRYDEAKVLLEYAVKIYPEYKKSYDILSEFSN